MRYLKVERWRGLFAHQAAAKESLAKFVNAMACERVLSKIVARAA